MINFATLQGLTIPEGVVTQITDASGRVLWALSGGKAILQVHKIIGTTYAAETSYSDEQFVLLDIYPKTNGTVRITYGGLTKTITDTSGAEEPNAIQVFFGTFNGVSDGVETPESGELTIKGDCYAFGYGSYAQDGRYKASISCCCVTAIEDTGDITDIPANAFSVHNYSISEYKQTLKKVVLKDKVQTIGSAAFEGCYAIEQMTIPASVNSIASDAFATAGASAVTLSGAFLTIDENNPYYGYVGNCIIEKATKKLFKGFSDSTIPQGIQSIGENAFQYMGNMYSDIVIPDGVTTIYKNAFDGTSGWTNMTIPNTVTEIYVSAFTSSDIKNATLRVLATTPPTVVGLSTSEARIFTCSSANGNQIIVPKGCADAYKAAPGWKKEKNYIVEAS